MATQDSTSQAANLQEDEFWASLHRGVQGEVTKTIPEDQLSPIIRDCNLVAKNEKLQAISDVQHRVSTYQAVSRPSAPEILSAMHALSMVQFERCDWVGSIATNRQILAVKEARDGPDTALAVRHNLALALFKDGQYPEAEQILGRLLPIEREGIGRSSPQALGCLRNLIEVLDARGNGEKEWELLGRGGCWWGRWKRTTLKRRRG